MVYKIFPVVVFALLSFTSSEIHPVSPRETHTIDPQLIAKTNSSFEMKVASVYGKLHSNNLPLPQLDSFTQALQGFYDLKAKGIIQKDVLTLIDFSLSSNTKRLWVIDMATNTVLVNTFVAHGRNTGEEFANSFSNDNSSFKSSLGFYATGEIYNGKHGKSLKLDGLEKGINDNARERGVVMHAADYVSESFIKSNNRLGRSQGCPAIPVELTDEIIGMIKNKSCLFIYHPSRNYKTPAKLIS